MVSTNLSLIKQGDAFYLQTLGDKQQYLMVYKENQLLEKINLFDTHVFGYDLSSFCWELTSNRETKIATMISKGQKCRNKTDKNPNNLINELTNSTFKF